MNKFLCRTHELEKLNQLYGHRRFEFVIVCGRRRAGKTSLIREFCKDKPTVFFSALNSTEAVNRRALSAAIFRFTQPGQTQSPVYQGLDLALAEITRLSREQQLVFVIDEYPCLAESHPAVSSMIQRLIDHDWEGSRLFLVLCGSSMSFMENQVLGCRSPLGGRCTAQLRIRGLDYKDTAAFNPDLSHEENALIYGITGGIPLYIERLAVRDSVDRALMENVFSECSPLFEETSNLLKQELRDPALYSAILQAIAEGAARQSEITARTQLPSPVVSGHLKVLQSLGLVRKETPVTEKPGGKKTVYRLDDLFFRFWYRFAPVMTGTVSPSPSEDACRAGVSRCLPDYMGLVFERMCREYLVRRARDLPVACRELGQWWGADPARKKQIRIGIVGVPVSGREFLICSCKYRNEKAGIGELELLREHARAFGKGDRYHFWLFSKSGFTAELEAAAERGEAKLVTLEDMYR